MKKLATRLKPVPWAAIVTLLIACGGPAQPEPTTPPIPAATATPSATLGATERPSVPLTATTAAIPTPRPTATRTPFVKPTPTPDLTPTRTPAPLPAATLAPTPTPVPSSTATPAPSPTPSPVPSPAPTATTFAVATSTPVPAPLPPVRASDIVKFTLESFTVSVGTKVTWTNRDQVLHTTTSGVPPILDGTWDSSFVRPSQQFSFTFNQAGVFPYWCQVHPFMTATVTVEGDPAG